MANTVSELSIEHNAPVGTWFRVGGGADRLARPQSLDELRACVDLDPALLVLGDGANLLVDDAGVGSLVVDLSAPAFSRRGTAEELPGGSVGVTVGAGIRLPKLISETVAAGLGGLEGLAGIPASVGGAVRMNAGGSFGEIATCVGAVHGVDRTGRSVRLEREAIAFGYRTSGLEDLIITEAELVLAPGSKSKLRERQRAVAAQKKATQPLGAKSAGCCFKNPTLPKELDGFGRSGERVPAGLLIDRAGGKSLSHGGARVSELHANFIVTSPDARAQDVIALMREVRDLVTDRFGVTLEREVVVWSREGVMP